MTDYPVPDITAAWSHTLRADGTVARRGRANVGGDIYTQRDGSPVDPAIVRALLEYLGDLSETTDGTVWADRLDAAATALFDVDPLIGSEHVSFHAIAYGSDGQDDIGDTALIWHNYRDPWIAARMRGLITDDEYPSTRDGCAPVDVGVRRRVTRWPMRTRLPRVWVRDSERGADHELAAPHTDPARIFIGHRCIARGETARQKRDRTTGRSIIRARSRSDRANAVAIGIGDLPSFVAGLATGDGAVAMIGTHRVRITRTDDNRYTATVTNAHGQKRRVGTNAAHRPATVAGIVDAVSRLLD